MVRRILLKAKKILSDGWSNLVSNRWYLVLSLLCCLVVGFCMVLPDAFYVLRSRNLIMRIPPEYVFGLFVFVSTASCLPRHLVLIISGPIGIFICLTTVISVWFNFAGYQFATVSVGQHIISILAAATAVFALVTATD